MAKDPRPTGDAGKPPRDDDLVVTPGGPARRKNVHRVGPHEQVRANPDGTYTVVPRP